MSLLQPHLQLPLVMVMMLVVAALLLHFQYGAPQPFA
jgi:hypothetical protein